MKSNDYIKEIMHNLWRAYGHMDPEVVIQEKSAIIQWIQCAKSHSVDFCSYIHNSSLMTGHRETSIYNTTAAYWIIKTADPGIIAAAFPLNTDMKWRCGLLHPYLIALAELKDQTVVLQYLSNLFTKSCAADDAIAHSVLSIKITRHTAIALQHYNMPELMSINYDSIFANLFKLRGAIIHILNSPLLMLAIKQNYALYNKIVPYNVNLLSLVADRPHFIVDLCCGNYNLKEVIEYGYLEFFAQYDQTANALSEWDAEKIIRELPVHTKGTRIKWKSLRQYNTLLMPIHDNLTQMNNINQGSHFQSTFEEGLHNTMHTNANVGFSINP